MEGESSEDLQSPSPDRCWIYKRGGPFYKLTKKEYFPSMNILKTFDIENPHWTDIKKDVASKVWKSNCFDAFILILGEVEVFSREENLTIPQVAAVYEIFYSCFKFFMLLPALKKEQLLEYFRETLVLYCVQDPPEALRIFNGVQAFDIAKLFHKLFEKNFEMMKYALVPEYAVDLNVIKDL